MILDDFKLDGKVAIVTGVRKGLGQAIAIGLAEAGANIVGVSRGKMRETEKKIETIGQKFLAIEIDLVSIQSIPVVIDKTVQVFGQLDILVNNAGTVRRAPAMDFTEKDWDDVINLNLKTVFFFCQAAASQFKRQNTGGKIINIASMLSFQGGMLVSSYTASKSGLAGLTRELACEWAKEGINVNAIAPGYMETDNTAPLRNDPIRSKAILERIPAGRWGKPDDIKGLTVFLASKASDYLHGFVYAVDGGWLAR